MMSDLIAVVPVLDLPTAMPCIESITMDDSACGVALQDFLIVDNTRNGDCAVLADRGFRVYRDPDGHNLGCARAWNVGAREVLDRDLDYLVIMSATMIFGPELHTTWRKQMETFWGSHVIEADGHSWHLIAFHRSVFETVGLFDESFWPAYEEALDFGYRMKMCGLEGGFARVWVNALSRGHGLHVNLNVIDCPCPPLQRYYAKKWGGSKGFEKFTLPFGDQPIGYFPERSIPELAAEYEIDRWW